jgi:hypothetical protein
MTDKHPPYEVGMRGLKWLGWVGLAFFGFCFVGSALSEPLIVSLMFLPFIALNLMVLSISGHIRTTQSSIELMNWWGVYRMKWDEIERVETGQSAMVFSGGDSRLSIPLPKWWSGDDAGNMSEFLRHQLKKRSLTSVQTFRSDYLTQKNTKERLTIKGAANG